MPPMNERERREADRVPSSSSSTSTEKTRKARDRSGETKTASAASPTATPAVPEFRRSGQQGQSPAPIPTTTYRPAQQYQQAAQKSPFWETEGFQQFINEVKAGRKTRGGTFAPEAQNIPVTPKTESEARFATYNEDYMRDQIRKDISNEARFKNPPRGVNQQQWQEIIKKETEKRLEEVTPPRYFFIQDMEGNEVPVYMSEEDENKVFMQSIEDKPLLQKLWLQTQHNVWNTVKSTLRGVGEFSMKPKEVLTDTNDPADWFGPLIQTGLNTAQLIGEYAAGGIANFITPIKAVEAEIKALKESGADPARLERLENQLVYQKSVTDRVKLARAAVERSWAEVNDAREYLQAHPEISKAISARGVQGMEERLKYYAEVEAQENQARQQASDFRGQAQLAYSQGDYETAVTLTKQAQDADRRSEVADPYGAYTWIREPERYDNFLTNTALAEVQKGAPLTTEEIRRIKEYSVNAWTELFGEFTIDPLNLLPVALMEDVIKLPFKVGGATVKGAREAFPVVDKVIDVMGGPVKWLRRQSVTSTGNQIARTVHNNFERVSKAYASNDEMVRAIDQIGDAILEAKRAPDEATARQIFTASQNEILGLQEITFNDFKQLMDASDTLDPVTWGKMYNDALSGAEDYLTNSALRNGNDPQSIVSDVSKSRIALQEMSSQFYKGFVDPHRIFKGSSFTDDTLAGWATKTLRNLSGEEVNEALKLSGFDDFIKTYGKTIGPKTKGAIQKANQVLEGSLQVASHVRDVWTSLVLSTPRWIVTNTVDTAFRDFVWGGNLWDDMKTLLTSTQRTLADEVGFVPIEFSQALSRADLDVTETVTSRLLYEGQKPGANMFAYWASEYKRLASSDAVIAKREILNKLLDGLPNNKLKSAIMWLGDGLNVKMPTILKAWPGAIADFNTAVEFTFRLRMFHREYFTLLEALEPTFMTRGLSNLSPATQEVARQIWKLSEGNPARLSSYVNNIIGVSKKGTPAEWSFLVPSNIDEATQGMDLVGKQTFISQVRSSLEEMISVAEKSGKHLSGDDFAKFIDEYKTGLQDEIQAHMSQTWEKRMNDEITKDGKSTKTPDANNLKGSAPRDLAEQPRAEVITKATEKLRKGKPFQRAIDVANNFEQAVADYATVQRVAGDTVRRTMKDGKVVIEIGDNVLKGKPAALYAKLHDVLLDVFVHTDEDMVLRGGFAALEEYSDTIRKFMDDPARVLADNERQFMTIANQFTSHPQLQDLISRTGKKFNFDSVMDVYRNYGVYDDAYGFNRPASEILQEMADQKVAIPGYHRAAAQEKALATTGLARLRFGTTLPEATRVKLGQYIEQWDAYQKGLRQFMTFVYPGPKMFKTGDARRAAWDMFFSAGADAYLKEAKIKNDLIELFASNPVEAERLMDESMGNFVDYFLKQNGIDVTWDTNRNIILNTKITTPDGKNINFSSRLDNAAVEEYFYSSKVQSAIKNNPLIQIDSAGKVSTKRQITYALRDTFDIPTARAEAWANVIDSHAQQWAKATGQDVSRYYERLGFQRLENAYGLGSQQNFRLTKRGAIQRGPDGQFVFYGLGQSNFESMVRETSELFYDDLVSMAEHSPNSADDLRALNDFIQAKTGIPVRGGILNTKQSEVFSEIFTRYVAEGSSESIKLKKPFEMFKKYLASTFEAVHTTEMGANLSDDLYRTMNRLFVEDQMIVKPTTNARAIKLMAQEAGVSFADEAELLERINQSLPPAPVSTSTTPIAKEIYKNIKNNPELARKLGIAIPGQERRVARVAVENDLRKSLYQRTLDEWDNLTKEEQRLTGASKWVDEHTGLENKNAFLKDAVDKKNPPAGMQNTIIDANSLTALNFNGGHTAGDAFIKEIGHQINEVVDEIMGKGEGRRFRYGGDEFVIWHDDPDIGRQIGEALDARFNQIKIYVTDDNGVESVVEGLSISHGTGGTFDAADAALYENKKLKSELGYRPPMGKGVDKNTLPERIKFTPTGKKTENIPVGGTPDIERPQTTGTEPLTPEMQQEWQNWVGSKGALIDFPPEALSHPAKFREYVLIDQISKEWTDIEKTFDDLLSDPNITPEIASEIKARMTSQQLDTLNRYTKMLEGLDRFDPSAVKIPKKVSTVSRAYTSLADVPKDVAARAFSTMDAPVQSKIMEEIQGAWDVWKSQRSLKGFPPEALTSADTFKAYLTERMGQEWSEASWHYNRMMAEVEQFEDAIMSYHSGATEALNFNPRVPEAQISNGMKTWIRNNESMLSNYESALRALDEWKPHLRELAEGKSPMRALTKGQKDELSQWAVQASKDKAEMIDLMMNGGTHAGRTIEGAIPKVNRVMLDYQHRNVFDQFARNIFPFWMFPSRSLPFWIETMATHPQLIAAYEKVQRMSRTQRYQAGAVTSQGKPLASLDGYIQIPGTDLWFNPLAPLSFRYALDLAKRADDIVYEAQVNEDNIDPKAYLAREFMETSQIYGFSVAPWMTFLMKEAFNLSDEVVPRFPIAPQISLVPRWFVHDQIQKANKLNFFGMTGWGDALYPEASWHDYLVERKLLEDALMKVRQGNLTLAQVDKLRIETSNAIKNKDTDLWKSAYRDLTTDEAYRNWGSFFTGIYAKSFTDGQAELLALRNDINVLKSAMNNEFQASVFGLPSDAEELYGKYINTLESDTGWVSRLYTDIGWVKNDLGKPVSGKDERNRWLAISITQNENQQLYYQRMKDLQTEYNERLRAVPVGSSYSQLQPIFDWYRTQRDNLAYLQKPGDKVYFTNKPTELIEKDLRDEWFRGVNQFAPRWDVAKGETYEQYQLRLTDWYAKLPEMAPQLMLAFQQQDDVIKRLNALREDQQLSPSFFKELIAATNPEGMDLWKRDTDDIFDALNGAWKDLYWDAYWNSGVTQSGYAGDLAEVEFLKAHPNPPSTTEIYSWMVQRYGAERFTFEEVQKWVEGADQKTIEQRQVEGKPADYEARQKIWDMLSWLGPGSRNQSLFNEAFVNAGGNPDDLTVWYEESGQAFSTKPERLEAFRATLEKAMQTLDLDAPSRTELVRYVQAQEENNEFKTLVTEELGAGFYDMMDYYYSLDTAGRKEFRDDYPDMYGLIGDYRDFKGQYGEDHPTWADYYGLDLTPSVGAAPEYTAPSYTSGGFSSPRVARTGQGGTSSPLPIPRRTQTSQHVSIPNFYIPSRLPSDIADFSPAFTQALGDKMMWEVEQLYSKNRRLSNAAVSYLMGLASRHTDWGKYVNRILDKNG